ncbi:cytochrome c oxidase subunit II [soil metagenome]
MNLVLILAVVFAILVLVRLANVASLASQLSGESEENEQDKDNQINGWLLQVFLWGGLAAMVYMIIRYSSKMLPVSASEHGVEIDKLMNINWAVVFVVFFITQILLFSFAFKYRHNKNRRSFFYHDNNKLEAIWTLIPTIVLAALITTGLSAWNRITDIDSQKDGMVIQLYGKQFDWTARYSGKDNHLGASNFRKITDFNPLGVDSMDAAANDDVIARELYLPAGIPVELVINSRDVIHSVFLPHFRVQMNAVPGMTTRFYFKPTITTAKMRELTGNPKFDYVLLCNKICGVAHYNMKMSVVVVEPADFKEWLKTGKPVFEKATDAPVVPTVENAAPVKPAVALK